MNPSDVSISVSGSASGPPGRFDRASQVREERVRAIHKPTGLSIEVSHGPAALTKKQWQTKRAELRSEATRKLEELVWRDRKRRSR